MNINPTPGRVVYYQPPCASGEFMPRPLAAIIAHVESPIEINVGWFDSIGQHHAARGVTMVQDGEPLPPLGNFAYWMPYQLGQAKKEAQPAALTDVRLIPDARAVALQQALSCNPDAPPSSIIDRASKFAAFLLDGTVPAQDEELPVNFAPPHENRVIAERDQLTKRTDDLQAFFGMPLFAVLHMDERARMREQHVHMANYLKVLNERIEAFGGAVPKPE